MKIQAEVEDSTHLRLKEPLPVEKGSVVTLEIVDSSVNSHFREGAAALLEQAYGDDEPDYSEAGAPLGNS